MDDFSLPTLTESRSEWSLRLIHILNPLVCEGIHSMFNEALKMCIQNKEPQKYLMTFQNLLSCVPKWNGTTIEEEKKRIIEKSGCNYLEDLITCIHIIQLKALTCIRVGNKQKKIDISIPKLDTFIHKIYIYVARKLYKNIYLFEKGISPLQQQRNNRDLELLVQDCILMTIRDSIPTESIIRAYMDESVEQEEEITIEKMPEEETITPNIDSKEGGIDGPTPTSTSDETKPPEVVPSIQNIDDEKVITRLTFNEYDSVMDEDKKESQVFEPKTLERLEEKYQQKLSSDMEKQMKEMDYAEDNNYDDAEYSGKKDPITILPDSVDLSSLGISDLDENDVPFLDIQELP